MKYFKQTDKYSCGVIAAMNLDLWRGKTVCDNDFYAYYKALKCGKRGTYRRHFSKWIGFRPVKLNWPKLKKHLQSGGAAVVFTRTKYSSTGAHLYFIDQVDGHWARCINLLADDIYTWVHWRWLCKLLMTSSVWRV